MCVCWRGVRVCEREGIELFKVGSPEGRREKILES